MPGAILKQLICMRPVDPCNNAEENSVIPGLYIGRLKHRIVESRLHGFTASKEES